jgi:hypothetical protein
MKYHICPWAFLGPCHKKCFRDLPIEMARDFQPSTYAENKDAHIYIYVILVGGIPTPLKNMKVSWEYYSQSMEK